MNRPVFTTPDFVLNPPKPKTEGARCAVHPESAATGNCARCGTFFCEADVTELLGRRYCDVCAARPDVNYLEAFRLRYWGKRDSWSWLVGFASVFQLIAAVRLFVDHLPVLGGYFLISTTVGVFYFLGKGWARIATLVLPFVLAAALVLSDVPQALGSIIFPLIISLGVFADTRNRLFFKVPVSDRALQRSWDLYANNSMARNGIILAGFSLLVPFFAPIALTLSILGLMRVDPNAMPPIGKRAHAVAGIVLSSIAMVELVGVVLMFMPKLLR